MMEVVLVIFPVALVKHANKNKTKEKGLMLAYSPMLHSIMVEKWKLRATGHHASIAKKVRTMDICVPFLL